MLPDRRWNIFARVLEDILTERHLGWQNLRERASIEQETIDLLQASLASPTAFPILSVEEMDEVVDVFDLNPYETLQLRAAIIATSVERMLMERIESQAAMLAAEQVFATVLDALIRQKDEKRSDTGIMSDEGPGRLFDEVKRYIDAGRDARHLSRSVSRDVRATYLQEALHHFEQARILLERERTSQVRSTRLWKQYHQQVQKECEQIRKELRLL